MYLQLDVDFGLDPAIHSDARPVPVHFRPAPVPRGFVAAGPSAAQSPPPRAPGRLTRGIKRAVDMVGAGVALTLLAPVMAAAAVAIRIEDGGPVLFRQTRIGEHGRPFTMLKFRSMVTDAERRRAGLADANERDSICFKIRADPRTTSVGRWLRRLSIDEAPQLFNVLRGDMALVGPRPALPDEVIRYAGRSWQRLRGKPGLTCIWQVSGRALVPFEQQVAMDIAYLARPSLWTDLMLMIRTVPAVIGGCGAY